MALDYILVDESFKKNPTVGHRVQLYVWILLFFEESVDQLLLQFNQVCEQDLSIDLRVIKLKQFVFLVLCKLVISERQERYPQRRKLNDCKVRDLLQIGVI